MTLKEKVKEVKPISVNDCYFGGVIACPVNYHFLNCERNIDNCGYDMDKPDEKLCTDCWKREFNNMIK